MSRDDRTDAAAERLLVATTSEYDDDERIETVVHALAQLPADFRALVAGPGVRSSGLAALANAYGVSSRVELSEEPVLEGGGIIVYPSRLNLERAPLRPNAAERAVALDAGGEAGSNGVSKVNDMAELLSALRGGDTVSPVPEPSVPIAAGSRVVIVTNYPTHYRVPLFERISRRLEAHGAELAVLFTAASITDRAWMEGGSLSFEHARTRSLRLRIPGIDVPLDIEANLARLQPSVVVVAGFSPINAERVLRWCRRRAVPAGIWSGGIDRRRRDMGRWRRVQRRRLLGRASFAIAYGYESGEHIRRFSSGIPMVYGRNTTPFGCDEVAHEPSAHIDTIEILAVSRAVGLKRLDLLIQGFRAVQDDRARLTIAGGGVELDRLRRQAAGDDRIRLLGAVPSSQVGALYERADIFAFPTRDEAFGLVMAEAFAAGLAVVSSREPGAIGDLGVNRESYVLVDDDDAPSWARAIEELLADADLRASLGARARDEVRGRWSLDHAAGAMISGIALGMNGTRL